MLKEFHDEINRLKAELAATEGLNNNTGNDNNNSTVNMSPPSVEGYSQVQLEEMKAKIEEEKKAILESKTLLEAEKTKAMAELNQRSNELENERLARRTLAQKLEELTQKLLVGGENILDKHAAQQELIAKRAAELEEQARKERQLQRELKEQEETADQIEGQYEDLKEEAIDKTKKLKKLWGLLMKHKEEMEDLRKDFDRDNQDLLETAQQLSLEIEMKKLIVDSFIPPEYLDIIKAGSIWDDGSGNWKLPQIQFAGNNIQNMNGTTATGHHLGKTMDEKEEDNRPMWNPLLGFPNEYLTYSTTDAPFRKPSTKRGPSILKSTSKIADIKVTNRPISAIPKARGLVSSQKRFA